MNILKVSDFFNNEMPPIILGAFFSRRLFVNDNKYVLAYTSYKESEKIATKEIAYNSYSYQYIKKLNAESKPYAYWYTKDEINNNLGIKLVSNNKERISGQAYFLLENDLDITQNEFYKKLYAKLVSDCEWIFDEELNEQKRAFIRGFMELRGSIDTTATYISQDYFYDSTLEIKKARLLVDYLSVPYNAININFRELQHDYYTGTNERNTQLRLNIWWYMENIGIINGYKAEVFAISRNLVLPKPKGNVYFFYNDNVKRRINNILDERLNFYSTNILGKKINDEDIKKMRNELNFDDAPSTIRNRALVEAIKYLTDDECACCKNDYDISERSHINRATGRYYFEIHHVISLGSNKELDDENNMVKLCPVCHAALRRGSGTEEDQKQIIRKIFHNAPNTLYFAKQFFGTNDLETIIDLTYDNLK